MNYVTYVSTKNEISLAKDAGVTEVIIAPMDLSRLSTNSKSEYLLLATYARELGLRSILEWDILINEVDFKSICQYFESIPTDLYDAVRVQDAGVLEYVLENSKKPIQLILENGNHNLVGIKKWESYVGPRLDRLVLSIELSKELLQKYVQELKCELEILVLGRILLFYSPRKLLSPLLKNSKNDTEIIEALGESEESPHKGFPITENKHGSFMFHIKDLFLLDKIEEIKQIGLAHLRLDLRSCDFRLIQDIVKADNDKDRAMLKKEYPAEVIRGYYQINKSDVLFKKLKNSRLQRQDSNYVGEVLEARKSDFMAIHLKGEHSLEIGTELKFVTPEGKEHFCRVHALKDAAFTDQNKIEVSKLALINYMSGVWTKSQVYFKE